MGHPVWYVRYHDDSVDRSYIVLLDANTGKAYPPATVVNALPAAQTAASNWSDDASLSLIEAFIGPNMNFDGKPEFWLFFFHSNDLDTTNIITTYNGIVISQNKDHDPGNPSALNTEWIDSDSSFAMALDMGGQQFIEQNEPVNVEVVIHSSDNSSIWEFLFMAPDDSFLITFGADKNETLVRHGFTVPKSYSLQNFPNPFNPETIIQYQLPVKEHVSIKVYDITGRQVAILTDNIKNAGKHQVRWKGLDNSGHKVSSGIYFYELKTDSYRQIEQMLLLK